MLDALGDAGADWPPSASTPPIACGSRSTSFAELRRAAAPGRRRRARPAWTRCSPGAPSYAKNAGDKGRRGSATRSRSTRSSPTVVRHRRGRPKRQVLDGCAHRLGAALRRHTLDAADRRREAGHARVPRPARARPRAAARPGAGPDRARRASTSATSGCCSTSSRTPTRSRSSWPCASPPPIPATADEPGWADVDGRARPPVRGRRPEAVDLPVPPRRHRHLPRRPRPLRARGGGPVELTRQLPHRRAGDRLGQRTCSARCSRRRPTPTSRSPRSPPTSTCSPSRGEPPVGPAGRGDRHASRTESAAGADVRAHRRGRRRRPRDHHRAWPRAWAGRDDGDDGWRPCRLGDITILVPARTSLPFLEDALERRRHPLPGRVELARLRHPGGARPADGAAGRRRPHRPPPHRRRPAHPAARLRRRRPLPLQGAAGPRLVVQHARRRPTRRRHRSSSAASRSCASSTRPATGTRPSELLDRIARDRRALELGFAEGRPRDVWRRLRFVIDQARAWSEATGGSLRAYLHWVDQQTAEGARVAEAVLPETDDDAVRIMTIHAAKGLEFPITIVSRPVGRARRRRAAPVEVAFPPDGGRSATGSGKARRHRGVRGAGARSTSRWATTSASGCSTSPAPGPCDHLVVSLHREERKNPPKLPRNRTNAELLLARHGRRSSTTLPDLGGEADAAARRPRRRARRRRPTSPRGRPSAPPPSPSPAVPARSPPPPSPTRARPIWAADPVLVPPPEPPPATPVQTSLFDAPRPPPRRRRRPATLEPRSSPTSTRVCRSGRATSTCRRG